MKLPLMPKATAVWLVENTKISFKQIAAFCELHELEIKGIADGDVAKGIKAYNPILAGQLTREEIELSSKDENRPLKLKTSEIENALAVMAVDNLPSELPRDSSREFGNGIVNEVIPFILGIDDGRILNATITDDGRFLDKYSYLKDYIDSK